MVSIGPFAENNSAYYSGKASVAPPPVKPATKPINPLISPLEVKGNKPVAVKKPPEKAAESSDLNEGLATTIPEGPTRFIHSKAKEIHLKQLQARLASLQRMKDPGKIMDEFNKTNTIPTDDKELMYHIMNHSADQMHQQRARIRESAIALHMNNQLLEKGQELEKFTQSLQGKTITTDMVKDYERQLEKAKETAQKANERVDLLMKENPSRYDFEKLTALQKTRAEANEANATFQMRQVQHHLVQRLAKAPTAKERGEILDESAQNLHRHLVTLRKASQKVGETHHGNVNRSLQIDTLMKKVIQNEPIEEPALRELLTPILQQVVTDYRRNFADTRAIDQEIRQVQELISHVQADRLDKIVLDPKRPKNRWPSNTMVVGGTHQETISFEDFSLRRFLRALAKSKSAPEALIQSSDYGTIAEKNSLPGCGSKQYAAPVVGKNVVNCWNKNENRPRYVLIIEGSTVPREADDTFQKSTTHAMEEIRRQYGDSVQFIVCRGKNLDEIRRAFERLRREGTNQSELMVLFNGHGSSSGLEPGVAAKDAHLQGAQIGQFWLRDDTYLTETQLKEWVQQLSHFNGILVLPFQCHSGAWVS